MLDLNNCVATNVVLTRAIYVKSVLDLKLAKISGKKYYVFYELLLPCL